ncbi:MAG: hypothetical protein IPJ41_11550 [Phycisphaerales bacterium]|nr:hypothetical protein [Phycisphaerales bacterium]
MRPARPLIGLLASAACLAMPAEAQPLSHRADHATPTKALAPPPDRQAAARQRVQQFLGDLQGFIDDDPAKRFSALSSLATATHDDPDASFVLTKMAIDAGLAAGRLEAAADLARQLAEDFDLDPLSLRTDLLRQALELAAADASLESQLRIEIRAEAAHLLETALESDRPDLASDIVRIRLDAPGPTPTPEELADIITWSRLIAEWRAALQPAREAALRLLQDPADPAANLDVGSYLCFTKGDWEHGLSLLARSDDPTLNALASALLNTGDDPLRSDAARRFLDLADQQQGLAAWRTRLFADSLMRDAYPDASPLTRLALEQSLISRPLFIFGPTTQADEAWQADNLHFWANHGHEGPGSWANVGSQDRHPVLVANRAGYVETKSTFPPEGVTHYRIEASIWSDMAPGASFEFCGQRLHLGGPEGISLEGGWRPAQTIPLFDGDNRIVIDGSPHAIAFTVNGQSAGSVNTPVPGHGPLVLRGWEGHVRCTKLVLWDVPDPSLTGYVRSIAAGRDPRTPG